MKLKAVAAIVLVLVIALLAVKLATAPLYAVYDDAECRQAYASARTLADSARVDLHPRVSSRRGVKERCWGVRVARVLDSTDISALKQPNE